MPNTQSRLSRTIPGLRRWTVSILAGAVLLHMVGLVLGLSALLYTHLQYKERGKTMVSIQLAGDVIAASLGAGLQTHSLIQTDIGWIVLEGPMSLRKDEPLTREERENHSRLLCDRQNRCVRLAEQSWWALL